MSTSAMTCSTVRCVLRPRAACVYRPTLSTPGGKGCDSSDASQGGQKPSLSTKTSHRKRVAEFSFRCCAVDRLFGGGAERVIEKKGEGRIGQSWVRLDLLVVSGSRLLDDQPLSVTPGRSPRQPKLFSILQANSLPPSNETPTCPRQSSPDPSFDCSAPHDCS